VGGALEFVLTYGYAVLFACVLAEQVGLPVPAVPVLLAVGGLAGGGRLSIPVALAVALAASLPADLLWYELGRRRGIGVLGVLCRVSLEPDSCVRRTENLFIRYGKGVLLFAKFIPGLSTMAPPLAGIVGIRRGPFLALDVAAALIWSGAWLALGYAFSDALDLVAALAARLGNWALLLVGGALAIYVIAKYIQRRRFYRSLRIARIEPEELRRRLDLNDASLVVIDTRSPLDVDAVPYSIPGARWITAEQIAKRRGEIPTDREVVVYCS
jgi:membrane protein DedA with SNARE-associated domain